jgi:hypothetical protein
MARGEPASGGQCSECKTWKPDKQFAECLDCRRTLCRSCLTFVEVATASLQELRNVATREPLCPACASMYMPCERCSRNARESDAQPEFHLCQWCEDAEERAKLMEPPQGRFTV